MTSESAVNPTAVVSAQTILVVEDEVLVRIAICAYLRDCGYKVVEAVNAKEAREILQRADIAIDLVFSGLQMKGATTGFGLAQWVRKNRPGLRLILAGSPEHAADAAAELCETGPTLAKPYEPQAVADHIRRLLAERRRK